MVSLDDVKDLVLYNRPFFLPIMDKDKTKGSAIMLLTPNYQSSINCMKLPYTINRRYFQSYYIEKSVQRYINNEQVYSIEDRGEYLHEFNGIFEDNIQENKLEFPSVEEVEKNALNESKDIDDSIYSSSGIIMDDKGRILVLEHKRTNTLSIPGGKFNPRTEDPEIGLIREIKEEVNIDIDQYEFLYDFTFSFQYADTKQTLLCKDYLFMIRTYTGKINNNEPNKHKFVKFMSVDEILKYKGEKSKILSYFLAKYGPQLPITRDGSYINRIVDKTDVGYKYCVLSGYEKDIKDVSKYANLDLILKESFSTMQIAMPKFLINIVCSGNENDIGFMDERNLIICTPKVYSKLYGNTFSYANYLRYSIFLYTIIYYNPKVLNIIAEPSAFVLAGFMRSITASESKKNRFSKTWDIERVYFYIYEVYGINELKFIIKNNDVAKVIKYAKEFVNYYYDSTGLDGIDVNSVIKDLTELKEETVEEGVTDLSKFSNSLKRKMRKGSVYKINKIVRDIESSSSTSNTSNPSGEEQSDDTQPVGESFNKYKIWSNNDYIIEDNIMYLFEDINYDVQLKNALYHDRFRSVKDVLNIYKKVKMDVDFIKYTFTDIARYGKRNLFFDLSYYNESFFRNVDANNEDGRSPMILKYSKIYAELLERLIKDQRIDSGYLKKTIFIPVLDWRHNNSTRMWIYQEDVNPISIIYYLIRTDRNRLYKIFGDNDVVFLGGRNYFKINFRNTTFRTAGDTTKFINLIKRLVYLGYKGMDPDPEGTPRYSVRGIAMNIIDKIETSQNVEINDLSRLRYSTNEPDIISKDPSDTKITIDRNNIIANAEKIAVKNNIVPDNTPNGAIGGIDKSFAGKTTANIVAVKTLKDGTQSEREKTVKASKQDTKTNLTIDDAIKNTEVKDISVNRAVNATDEEKKKQEIVDKIARAASSSVDPDDALNKLDTDDFKQILEDLATTSKDNIRISQSRASKMAQIEDEFHKKEVQGKSIQDLLKQNPNNTDLPKTSLPVASINDDWKNLTFMNFDKGYDPDADMVKMLDSMKNWSYPVVVRDIHVEDNSTSEDALTLWTIECEDYKGTKFTLKVDIPKFIEGNFLKLRGNEKVIMIQSALVPVIKTDVDTAQIIGIGGYNKIFVRRNGAAGKATASSYKLLKSITKADKASSSSLKIVYGDNSNICDKYELPIDYIDIAGYIDSIENDEYKFYFNQDEFRLHYQVDDKFGIPIGIKKKAVIKEAVVSDVILYFSIDEKKVYHTIGDYIGHLLSESNESFKKIYDSINPKGIMYQYSDASILSTKMPLILICAYLEGLIPTLNKARIKYSFKQKLSKEDKMNPDIDYIVFNDGYLIYELNYSSSLLMNGLKKNDTENYSIKDTNGKQMYMDFLEIYGGRLKADGLENSYDCMLDPITKEILEIYKLPTDYVTLLLHANNLLADNKYVQHGSQSARRWRRKELIAGYFYKALSQSYQIYANTIRHTRKNAKMTMKQSAVIDLILSKDPSTGDLSVNNAINDVECTHTVTNKGLVGLNTDRAYSADKRNYDDSMLNVLGMDTGFSGNVGINRQATIDANIQGNRGLVKSIDNDTSKLSVAKTLTITEALTPLGSTHDDPPRTLMTYVQTSKHMVRCLNNDPMLITNGADEAMPYLTSDIFAFKAKQNGTVVEINDKYMIIEYKDGSHEYVDLSEQIKKNSDGGYSVPLRLSTDLHLGSKFKEGEVLAYDKLSFSNGSGESGNLALTAGTLAKVAILNTDEGFEDSAAITEEFGEKLGTEVVMSKEIVIDKGANVYMYKNIGDHVNEGETILSFQSDFDDEVSNTLMKNLAIDKERISELGRTPLRSKYTGYISDIKIYRTVELDELSPSLRKIVEAYEKRIKDTKSVYAKYGIDSSTLPATKKMDQVGKAKNINNGVKIIFYIKYIDDMAIGDKIVFYSANKGIIKYMIPKGQEPYTEFRPTEHIDSFGALGAVSARMVGSVPIVGAVNKLMVELDRSVKDICGIPYDPSHV